MTQHTSLTKVLQLGWHHCDGYGVVIDRQHCCRNLCRLFDLLLLAGQRSLQYVLGSLRQLHFE
jgi:hypothetical protein